jgi:hypothetical protein
LIIKFNWAIHVGVGLQFLLILFFLRSYLEFAKDYVGIWLVAVILTKIPGIKLMEVLVEVI